MKPIQTKGIMYIVFGVLLFIPFFLAFFKFVINFSFSDTLTMAGLGGLGTFASVLGLFTLLAGIALAIYGILLLLPNVEAKLPKFMQLVMPLVAGILGLVTGIVAIAYLASENMMSAIGVGTILYIVFGALTILGALAARFMLKDQTAA